MRGKLVILVALVAAVALSSSAAASPDGAKQRVAIVGYGVAANPNAAKFTLIPLQAGVLKRDSGTLTAVERRASRDA